MNLIFKSEIIEYEHIGNGNKNILFLHGWGGNKNSFQTTINLLKNKFKILSITMPTIKNTNLAWNLYDYCNLILSILKLHNIYSTSIVCHSFGFRVATILKHYINIEELIITGGAGPKKVYKMKILQLQNNKVLTLINPKKYSLKHFESKDYSILSETNKNTFKNIVNFNLKNHINFNCPILLFWGKKDTDTKLWIAKLIKKQNNAKLITTNSDHFAYLKLNSLFNHEIIKFLEKGL